MKLLGSAPLKKERMDNDELMLHSMFAFGLSPDHKIHRYNIFAYVQSHLAIRSEEALQGAINKKYYFDNIGDGYYVLNDLGRSKLNSLTPTSQILKLSDKFIFQREWEGDYYSVIVNPLSTSKKFSLFVNGKEEKGKNAKHKLEQSGASFITHSGTDLRTVFNWIVQSESFKWYVPENDSEIINVLRGIAEPLVEISKESDEISFTEGKEKYRLHRYKERNSKIVNLAKQSCLEKSGRLDCQICGFNFSKMYGEVGVGFIEAHHIIPISELNEEVETNLSDIIMICSNCHRMIHRRRPWLSIDEIKMLVKNAI